MRAAVDEAIQVNAARIPDRDRLLRTLAAHGVEARAVGEVDIEVPCGGDAERVSADLYTRVEALVLELGEPFVPVKKDGTIYFRPPGD